LVNLSQWAQVSSLVEAVGIVRRERRRGAERFVDRLEHRRLGTLHRSIVKSNVRAVSLSPIADANGAERWPVRWKRGCYVAGAGKSNLPMGRNYAARLRRIARRTLALASSRLPLRVERNTLRDSIEGVPIVGISADPSVTARATE
jgi:hypothetical protein